MKVGELHDLLHDLFGIGDYDDGAGPWYQWRAIEMGKLNAMLKARHCTVEEVAEAAYYADAHHVPITQSWQVFKLVPEALKARRLTVDEDRQLALRDSRSLAIREALDLHDTAWAERLMRTPDAHLAAVLGEWRNHVHSLP